MGLEFSISDFYEMPEMTEIMPHRNMFNELQEMTEMIPYGNVINELQGMTTKCLEENSAEVFRVQQQNLLNVLEQASFDLYAENEQYGGKQSMLLSKLSSKCGSAKSLKELKSIASEYTTIMNSAKEEAYSSALRQQGINAQVSAFKNEASKYMPEVVTENSVHKSAEFIKPSLEQVDKPEVIQEALKRTQAQNTAKETAAKAQKYYTQISDATTGKSAQQSAEVIKTALEKAEKQEIAKEALKRTQAENAAKETAAKAQKYYTQISDATTGKSAQQSAEVFKTVLEKAEKQELPKETLTQANKATKETASKLSDATKDKVDDVLKTTSEKQNIKDKVKNLYSKKIAPVIKTKKFKAIVGVATALAIITGIIIHNNKAKKDNQKSGVIYA